MKPMLPSEANFKVTNFGKLPKMALLLAVIGLVATLISYFVYGQHHPEGFYRSYLIGFMFWFNMGAGCLFWLMTQHLSGGHWGVVTRRVLEAGAKTIVPMIVLFIPVAVGMHSLYEWTHEGIIGKDPVIAQKAAYLNAEFFWVRFAFYFIVWGILTLVLSKLSDKQDATADPRIKGKLANLSGPGMVLFFLTMTFAGIDWLLSLEPHYFSTMYGPVIMSGQALGSMAMIIAVMYLLTKYSDMSKVMSPGHFHDLGKFMFAATMFWAYVNFSSYLITWGANIAEETPYYLRRMSGGWVYVSMAMIAFHFILPFVVLLNRDIKRNPKALIKIAYYIIALRFMDLCWLILPSNTHEQITSKMEASTILIALAAVVGIGGIWFFVFLKLLTKKPLLPINDPYLKEALEFRGGH